MLLTTTSHWRHNSAIDDRQTDEQTALIAAVNYGATGDTNWDYRLEGGDKQHGTVSGHTNIHCVSKKRAPFLFLS